MKTSLIKGSGNVQDIRKLGVSGRNFFSNRKNLRFIRGDVQEAVRAKQEDNVVSSVERYINNLRTKRLGKSSRNAGEMNARRIQEGKDAQQAVAKQERNDYIRNKNRDRDVDMARDTKKAREEISATLRNRFKGKSLIRKKP